jgi:hypothetical protein
VLAVVIVAGVVTAAAVMLTGGGNDTADRQPTQAGSGPATTTTDPPLGTSTTIRGGDGGDTTTSTGAGDDSPPTATAAAVDPVGLRVDGTEPAGPPSGFSPLDGAPDRAAAARLAAAFENVGIDMTQITVWVWPAVADISGILVLEVIETAPALQESGGADAMVGALFGSDVLREAGVGEVSVVYRGRDPQGPFSITLTTGVDALRTAWEAGTDLPDDAVTVDAHRE